MALLQEKERRNANIGSEIVYTSSFDVAENCSCTVNEIDLLNEILVL